MNTVEQRVLSFLPLAEKWARQTGVPVALILATIEMESGGRVTCEKFEPTFRLSPKTGAAMTEAGVSPREQRTSYGLMQMMLPVAWGYGARSKADLFDANKAIRYGTAHIAALAQHRKAVKPYDDAHIRAIAGAYNGSGAAGRYAANVLALCRKYQGLIKEVR